MICALVRNRPESGDASWREFLELVTSLALFGQPLRVIIMASAGDCLEAGSGMLEDTLLELAGEVMHESSPDDAPLINGLLHQSQHCMVF